MSEDITKVKDQKDQGNEEPGDPFQRKKLTLGSLLSQDMEFRKSHRKGLLQERVDKLKSFIKYWHN